MNQNIASPRPNDSSPLIAYTNLNNTKRKSILFDNIHLTTSFHSNFNFKTTNTIIIERKPTQTLQKWPQIVPNPWRNYTEYYLNENWSWQQFLDCCIHRKIIESTWLYIEYFTIFIRRISTMSWKKVKSSLGMVPMERVGGERNIGLHGDFVVVIRGWEGDWKAEGAGVG